MGPAKLARAIENDFASQLREGLPSSFPRVIAADVAWRAAAGDRGRFHRRCPPKCLRYVPLRLIYGNRYPALRAIDHACTTSVCSAFPLRRARARVYTHGAAFRAIRFGLLLDLINSHVRCL